MDRASPSRNIPQTTTMGYLSPMELRRCSEGLLRKVPLKLQAYEVGKHVSHVPSYKNATVTSLPSVQFRFGGLTERTVHARLHSTDAGPECRYVVVLDIGLVSKSF